MREGSSVNGIVSKVDMAGERAARPVLFSMSFEGHALPGGERKELGQESPLEKIWARAVVRWLKMRSRVGRTKKGWAIFPKMEKGTS